jgi:hypothetical protein
MPVGFGCYANKSCWSWRSIDSIAKMQEEKVSTINVVKGRLQNVQVREYSEKYNWKQTWSLVVIPSA